MNRLKSIFISLYVTALAVGVGRALWGWLKRPEEHVWLWVLLALLPAFGFFARLFLFPVARTGLQSLATWLPAVVAAVGLAVVGGGPEPWFWTIGVGVLGGALYVLWYSRFVDRNSDVLKVGERLPALQFETADGGSFATREQNNPLLLIFYRGNWCPLCVAQVREVAAVYRELAERGVSVLLISPQSHGKTAKLAEEFDAPMEFLVDNGNQMARRLGIEAIAGTPTGLEVLGYESDTVQPTVVITDAQQKILFADLTDNYRVRPEPATFLQILGRAGIGTSETSAPY